MPVEKDESKKRKLTKTFMLDFEGTDGEKYQGKFTCKRLNISEISELGVLKTKMNGGYYAVRDEVGRYTGQGIDSATDQLNEAIATCTIALIQKPEWWDMETLYDPSVITEVYKEVLSHEESFRLRRGDAEGSEDGSESESEGQERDVEDSGEVVEPKVPKIRKKR